MLAPVKRGQDEVMENVSNSTTEARRIGIVVSAWVVGLTIWAAGMVGLATFF
jgi:NO-binding membrane sensor protein with MHYT domain